MRKIICDSCHQPMTETNGQVEIPIPSAPGKHLGTIQIRLLSADQKDICGQCVFDAIATYADRKPRAVA